MDRTFPGHQFATVRFAYHLPTGRVATVVAVHLVRGTSASVTVRLIEGNLLTADEGEFRPATEPEIAQHQNAIAGLPLGMAPGLADPPDYPRSHP